MSRVIRERRLEIRERYGAKGCGPQKAGFANWDFGPRLENRKKAFVLRLDFGLRFVFMGLAGILNEVLLRLEIGRRASGALGMMFAGCRSGMLFAPWGAIEARLMIT